MSRSKTFSVNLNLIQHDFTAGELTPYFRGRSDLPNYSKGVRVSENFLVKPQGPLMRRPPTKYVVESETEDTIRLVPMQPNADEGYILEFSDLQLRILQAETDLIVKTMVTTYTSAQISDIRVAGSIDVLFIVHEDHAPAILERVGPLESDWTLTDIVFKDGPYSNQTPEEEEITLQLISNVFRLKLVATGNPFAAVVVNDYVEYKQNGVTLLGVIFSKASSNEVVISPVPYVAENLSTKAVYTVDTAPSPTILMSSVSTFSTILENSFVRFIDKEDSNTIKWVKVGKYRGFLSSTATGWDWDESSPTADDSADAIDVLIDPVTFVTAPVTTIITEDTNTAVITSDTDLFDGSRDIGRFLRLFLEATPVIAKITAVTNAKSVTVSLTSGVPLDNISEGYINEGRTKIWTWGAFYPGNYPRAVALYQQRLWFGGTPANQESFWGSMTNKFFTFSPTDEKGLSLATSGISAILDGIVLNKIRWMHASQVLFIGTEGAEFRVSSASASSPVTPSDIIAIKESENGSKIPPVEIGSTILFLQLSGQKLREFEFSFQKDRFLAFDITLQSDHIFSGSLSATEMSYQKEPNSVLWLVRSDGQLVGLTFIKEQDIRGWTRHIIGGIDAKVLSIATVRHSGLTTDSTYMVVERTVDGGTVRNIEKVDVVFSPQNATDTADMVFLDSYKKITGPIAAGTPIAGFDHAEGETLSVVTDGAVRDEVIVTGGEVTLVDDIDDQSYIGYPYLPIVNAFIMEEKIDAPTGSGTHQASLKNINKVNLLLVDSLGYSIGPSRDELVLQSFRHTSDPQDQVPPLRTGFDGLELDGNYDSEGSFWIAQEQPYPLNIAAIVTESVSA